MKIVNRGNNSDALLAVLTNPPLNTKNQAIKVVQIVQRLKGSI